MVTFAPAVIVPRAHGKAVMHAPLLETNVRFAGVGSLTETPVAFEAANTLAGPVIATERSADGFTVTEALAELLALFGSNVLVVDAVAVLDIVPTAEPLNTSVIVSLAPGPRLGIVQFTGPVPVQ